MTTLLYFTLWVVLSGRKLRVFLLLMKASSPFGTGSRLMVNTEERSYLLQFPSMSLIEHVLAVH